MSQEVNNPFDRAAKFALTNVEESVLSWLLRYSGDERRFIRWLPTEQYPAVLAPEFRMDQVARLRDTKRGSPWAMVVEFKLEPEVDVLAQTMGYEAYVFLTQKPDDLPGSRYFVSSMVINLTGHQEPFKVEEFEDIPEVQTPRSPVIRNIGDYDAAEMLTAIENGERSLGLLPWVALMKEAGTADNIEWWKRLALRQTDVEVRAGYCDVAVIFADAVGTQVAWKNALKGFNMIRSKVVEEWQQEAREEGEARGEARGVLVGQIQMLLTLLREPVQSVAEFRTFTVEQLQQVLDRLRQRYSTKNNGA